MSRNLSGYSLTLAMALAGVTSIVQAADLAIAKQADNEQIERGRYMVKTGHCNNCHTAGFANSEGQMPEEKWLLGSGAQGWRGPWGTTYASNLRINVHAMSETQWVDYVKSMKTRPPMPFWSTAATTPQDLAAMYKYIKQLGSAGEPGRQYLPPDQEPKPPFIQYPMPVK